MACTNHCGGWPGYRWGRGPDWTTTGVTRPVTEIQRSIVIPVDDFTGGRADQVFVDLTLADQPARRAIRCGVAVVDLGGREPPICHRQHAAVAGGLVSQLRLDQTQAGIRDRPAERPAAHTAFHGLQIESLITRWPYVSASSVVSWWTASRRKCTHRRSSRDSLAFAAGDHVIRRCDGKVHVRRAAGRVSVAFSGAGFGYSVMVCSQVVVSIVATVAKVRIPRSIPARTAGRFTVGAVVGLRSA
jgi:hypothetical protein